MGGSQQRQPCGHHEGNIGAGIEILYSYPEEAYSKLGAVSIRHWRPGFRDPTVEDAREKLMEAGQRLGATAVVIIETESSNRTILIRGEAIEVADPS